MTKRLEGIRDELASDYAFGYLETKYNEIEMANMPRSLAEDAYKAGFDAAVKELWPEIENLLEALDMYAVWSSDDPGLALRALEQWQKGLGGE